MWERLEQKREYLKNTAWFLQECSTCSRFVYWDVVVFVCLFLFLYAMTPGGGLKLWVGVNGKVWRKAEDDDGVIKPHLQSVKDSDTGEQLCHYGQPKSNLHPVITAHLFPRDGSEEVNDNHSHKNIKLFVELFRCWTEIRTVLWQHADVDEDTMLSLGMKRFYLLVLLLLTDDIKNLV